MAKDKTNAKPSLGQRLRQRLRGTGKAVLHGVGSGALGGGVAGGIGAAVERGPREFVRGAMQGAHVGSVIGGVMGGVRHLTRKDTTKESYAALVRAAMDEAQGSARAREAIYAKSLERIRKMGIASKSLVGQAAKHQTVADAAKKARMLGASVEPTGPALSEAGAYEIAKGYFAKKGKQTPFTRSQASSAASAALQRLKKGVKKIPGALNQSVEASAPSIEEAKKRAKKWMQKASERMQANGTEGSLHRALGVPEGEKIPVKKLMQAKNSPSAAIRKKANFAVNAAKAKHEDAEQPAFDLRESCLFFGQTAPNAQILNG